MSKRGAFYGRVSTKDQAEHGTSLQSQVEYGRAYAARNDITLIGEFVEDFSGAILSRPALNKVRELVRSKGIDVLIVYDLDRLTRSLAHSILLREELERHGVELHTIIGGLSATTPEAAMQVNLRAMFAEYERAKINERTERGRMQKLKNGILVQHNRPLYGYEMKDGKLTIREDQAAIVRNVFDWYINGIDGQIVGFKGIAARLSSDRTPTPMHDKPNKNRVRAPFMWGTMTIRRIVTNSAYMGTYRYGKVIGKHGVGGRRKDEDTVVLNIPAVVSPEIWKAAQERIKTNTSRARGLKKHNHILSGLCVCGHCGFSMSVVRQGSRFAYRCSQPHHRHKKLEELCIQPRVNTKRLEDAVWAKTVQFLLDPQHFEQAVKGAMEREREGLQGRADRLAAVSNRTTEIRKQVNRIAARLMTIDDNSLMAEALKAQSAQLEDEYRQLIAEQAALNKSIKLAQTHIEDIAATREYMSLCQFGLEDATPDDKRSIFEKLGLRVAVTDSAATLSYQIQIFSRSFEIAYSNEFDTSNETPTSQFITVKATVTYPEIPLKFQRRRRKNLRLEEL